MAVFNNQKGFWAKRGSDTNPTFVSVGGLDTPDSVVEQQKKIWKERTNYTGDLAGNNVQWVGEDPNTIYTDIAAGNVTAFTPEGANAVEDTYFDTLLKNIENQYAGEREQAAASRDTLVKQLKESRVLFNEDLERTYGKALQKANADAYSRGIGNSGIRKDTFREAGTEKNYQTRSQDLRDQQKEEIANQDYQFRMQQIQQEEARARAAAKSPYATFQYN